MKAFHFAGFLIFLFSAIHAMKNQQQLPIVACHLDLVSQNASTGKLVTHALTKINALVSLKSWWHTPKLLLMAKDANAIATHAESIAKTTAGSTNVIKELLSYLKDNYGTFFEANFDAWCELAVTPEIKKETVNFMKLLPKHVTYIGISNHDPIEHKLYRKKLKEQGVDLNSLFTTIIGVPSLETSANAAKSATKIAIAKIVALLGVNHKRIGQNSQLHGLPSTYFKKVYRIIKPEILKDVIQQDNFDNFVVAQSPYPSESFIDTLREIAHKTQQRGSILIFDSDPTRMTQLKQAPDISPVAVTTVSQLIPTLNGK